MKKESTIYIDGNFVKVDPKIIDAFTPGEFKAKGVFETMLAIGEKVFDTDLHLKRLKAAFPGANVSDKIIEKVVKANGFDHSRVRVIAWKEGRHNHLAVMALKYQAPQSTNYRVCLIKTNRVASARFANIKSLNYAMFANAYKKARLAGFDEALLLNNKGHVFEASRANVFWMAQGQLYTPPLSSGCLNGITRHQVIQYAKKLKIPFQEKSLSIEQLRDADCVFLTNSLIGLKPIKLSYAAIIQ